MSLCVCNNEIKNKIGGDRSVVGEVQLSTATISRAPITAIRKRTSQIDSALSIIFTALNHTYIIF